MKNETDNCVILVQLDAWFDLRMGTLLTVSDDKKSVVQASGYKKRKTDTWSDIGLSINQAQYDKLIKEPNADVLKNSVLSNMVRWVHELCAELLCKHASDPMQGLPEVHVNIHPFTFTAEVLKAFTEAVTYWMPDGVPIKIINYNVHSLTPEVIKANYGMVVMYDFNGWLSVHRDALQECKLYDTPIVYPAIYFTGSAPNDDEIEEIARSLNLTEYDKDELAFASIEKVLGEWLHLMSVDVDLFCFMDIKIEESA